MRKRKGATPPPVTDKLNATTLISNARAVALIAATLRDKVSERHRRERARQRLRYAVEEGYLAQIRRGWYTVGELGRWLRATWPGKFDHIPANYSLLAGTGYYRMEVNAANFRVGIAASLPTSIDACHHLIRKLDTERQELRTRLAQAESILARSQHR